MLKKLDFKKLSNKDICKILFIFSMIYFVILGFILSYNFDFSTNLDLLFESDTGRVINDISNIFASHHRLKVHPLFVILTEPIFFIFKGLTINNMIALIIMSSLVSSLTVVFIYKLLSLYSDNNKLKTLIVLCYLFSFSNIIYTSGIEIYNYAALFLVILWYYIFKKIKNNDFSSSSFTILIILGILSFAFTITNGIIFLIVLFILLIFKKVKFKDLFLVGFFTLTMLINTIIFQNMIWHNTPTIGPDNYTEEQLYTNYDINFDNIKNVIKGDYANSILSSNIYAKLVSENGDKRILNFNDMNIFNIIVISTFYILLLILIIRNYKYNKFANTGLILSLLFNTALHTVYGNDATFLYSLHFVYIIFILFGINLINEKNNKLVKYSIYYLIFILLCEIIINNILFMKVVNIVSSLLNNNYYISVFGLTKSCILIILLVITLAYLIYLLIKFFKKIKSTEEKDKKIVNIVICFLIVLLIQCIFITLETSAVYETFIFFPLKSNNSINQNNMNIDAFKNEYKEDITGFTTYLYEYSDLLNNYDHESITYLNSDNNYFFFGLGNRRKLLYKDNKLIDLETKYNVYSFDLNTSLVIPNLYTVLILTNDGEYIKIKEDNNGVHYITKDKDTIIKGTDNYIELFEFSNQKYQNIKKVLYNEILFNIKDSIIYPNILVYDKPWYRDAALASMVLKETNNTDLISSWVKNISEIYDKQNNGNKEPDNLGQLLYILSTQKNINYKLVNKIENEAKGISKNKKYLSGTTDFKERPLYQNLWYKFGLESLGKKYIYDLPQLVDDYASTAWWSNDFKPNNYILNLGSEYPYLIYANYHTNKNGTIPLSSSIYPLSWEKNASEAKYDKMTILDDYYYNNKISPLHTWSASELLLLLLDETNNLKSF